MSGSVLLATPGIYQIVNAQNNHCYIGSTNNLRKRLRVHFWHLARGSHQNSHLQHAYVKYGVNAFEISILEYVSSESDLIAREQHYIDSLKPEYNLSPAAGRIVRTPEMNEKISRTRRMKFASGEYTFRISAPRPPEVALKMMETKRAKRALDPSYGVAKDREKARKQLERMTETNRGRKHTPEEIARSSSVRNANNAAKRLANPDAFKQSPETVEKRIAPLRGRKQSPEHTAKSSATKRERRALDPSYGVAKDREYSAETRARISAAKKVANDARRLANPDVFKWSPEEAERRVAPLRGRKHSPEHTERVLATKRERRALDPSYGVRSERKQSPETVAKRVATRKANKDAGHVSPLRGRKRSPEMIERVLATKSERRALDPTYGVAAERKKSPEEIERRNATFRANKEATQYVSPLRGRKRSPEMMERVLATKRAKRALDPSYGVRADRKQSPETVAKRVASRKATLQANKEAKQRAALEKMQSSPDASTVDLDITLYTPRSLWDE